MSTIVTNVYIQHAPIQARCGPDGGTGRGTQEPGGRQDRTGSVVIAAFTSPLTERLGREAGFPLMVIDAVADPGRHAARLSKTWHAAWTARPGWFYPFDYHYDDRRSCSYAHTPLDPRWMGRHDLPTGLGFAGGCLTVDVPVELLADFAQAFNLALADRTFERVASRPGRVAKRFANGRELAIFPRYACDPALMTTKGQFTRVSNLFAVRPRDLPKIAEAAASAASVVGIRAALGRLRDHGHRQAGSASQAAAARV